VLPESKPIIHCLTTSGSAANAKWAESVGVRNANFPPLEPLTLTTNAEGFRTSPRLSSSLKDIQGAAMS